VTNQPTITRQDARFALTVAHAIFEYITPSGWRGTPPLMEKISQRTEADCVVCVLAMVMGQPYTYERVLEDSEKYPKTNAAGQTIAWWKDYLSDEGFEVEMRPLSDPKSFSDLACLPEDSQAMLVFQIPHMKIGHIVAIDKFGVIDPQDHPAEYRSVDDFCGIFRAMGWRLYSAHFWLVRRRNGSLSYAQANP